MQSAAHFPVFIKPTRCFALLCTLSSSNTSWVAIFGVGFAIVRLLCGLHLNSLAGGSAAAWFVWIATIVSCRDGVGSSVLITATGLPQFVVGWLYFGEKFRSAIGMAVCARAVLLLRLRRWHGRPGAPAQHASLRQSQAHLGAHRHAEPEESGIPGRPAEDPGVPLVKPRSRSCSVDRARY